jgi:GDPmannose 4,6-dehydratase
MAVSRIVHGLQKKLYLGNLDAKRDWGYAGEYVEAMWKVLQQKKPDDYVIATGKNHSVREFVDMAFKEAGIDIAWKGKGKNERAVVRSITSNIEHRTLNVKQGAAVVAIDPRYYRPTEVDNLLGDPSKARKKLGWKAKVKLPELVRMMMESDMKLAEKEVLLKKKKLPLR